MRTIIILSVILATFSCNAQKKKVVKQSKNNIAMHTDTAIFGEGCFWCTEV